MRTKRKIDDKKESSQVENFIFLKAKKRRSLKLLKKEPKIRKAKKIAKKIKLASLVKKRQVKLKKARKMYLFLKFLKNLKIEIKNKRRKKSKNG